MTTLQTGLEDINFMYQTPSDRDNSIQMLNNNLNNVTSSLTQLKTVQANALSKQNEIKNIIDDETDRLDEKKDIIDQAMQTQNRIIYFNDNSRKRYSAYLQLVITITIILAVLFLLTVLQKYLGGFIPAIVFTLLWVITISVGVIYVYSIIIEIRRHNLYNYDELNFSAPPAPTTLPGDSNKAGAFDLSIIGCVSENCCNAPTVWDSTIGKCIMPAPTTAIPSTPVDTPDSMITTIPTETTTPTETPDVTPAATSMITTSEYAATPAATSMITTIQTKESISPLESFEYENYASYK